MQFVGPARVRQPEIALQELPHIDVVAISHNHYDHLDRGSIRALARQPGGAPKFLVSLGLKAWLEAQGVAGAVELDWWDAHELIAADGRRTGDTGYSKDFSDARERLDLGAKRSLGVHWGTFQLADDPLDQPLHELAGVCRAQGVAAESFFLLPVGGTRRLARRSVSWTAHLTVLNGFTHPICSTLKLRT